MKNKCILPQYADINTISFGFYSLLSEEEQENTVGGAFKNQTISELIKSNFKIYEGEELLLLKPKLKQHIEKDGAYIGIEDYAQIRIFQEGLLNNHQTTTIQGIKLFMERNSV